MDRLWNIRKLTISEITRLPSPVLICSNYSGLEKTIFQSGYKNISLNLPLARTISGLPERGIPALITETVRELLPQSSHVYLTDYEILFDPRYELDIIKLFIDLSRRNKLIVKWCGAIDGDELVYAEQGFTDYKRFSIKDYDISVVK